MFSDVAGLFMAQPRKLFLFIEVIPGHNYCLAVFMSINKEDFSKAIAGDVRKQDVLF
jgi:hypothetical protein